jgi:hypothetical protein
MSGITVGDLLNRTYDGLKNRNQHQEIVLDSDACAEIADDTDWHRSRTGYMCYKKVDLFNLEKPWLLGHGKKGGSYPARPYDSDILALEFSSDGKEPRNIQKEIEDKIVASTYFQNSLVFGYADGNLGLNKEGRFGKRMMQLIKPNVQKFIAQKPEYNDEVLELSTLSPPFTKEMLYKPEFAKSLTEAIETVLKEESK